MPRHSGEVRLRHMLDHAREAVDLARGKSRTELSGTRLLQLGLMRLVEIIGEAAARVPKEERAKYPALPWEDVVGMRNKLIHGYDTVDFGHPLGHCDGGTARSHPGPGRVDSTFAQGWMRSKSRIVAISARRFTSFTRICKRARLEL